MTGSLQTKNGIYYVVLSFKDDLGKWRQKWINTQLPTKDNKTKAKAFLTKTLAEYGNANITHSKDILFIDFMYKWLETVANSIEENTHESYHATITRYIKPYFTQNPVKLQRLEPQHIQSFYNGQLKNGTSASGILRQHANIRKALQHAVKMNMIPYNPADRVTLPKKQEFHANFYNAEEVNTLLSVFKNEEMYTAVLLASFYGLRRSEVLGLKWECVDFNANTLTIRDAVVRCGNKAIIDKPRTKTKASHRTLPLIPSMREYLQELKRRQTENRLLFGAEYVVNDYVCKRANGEPFSPNYITCRFNKLIKRHNLPKIRFHDLRHSAASNLLAMGYSLKEIQEWLGHGTLATTADIYAHLQVEAKQDMAVSLGEKLVIC